jgi:hypothetical protein
MCDQYVIQDGFLYGGKGCSESCYNDISETQNLFDLSFGQK